MASRVPSLFLLVSLSTLLLSPSAYSSLFVEYIGSRFTGVRFDDVPINPRITNFQFLLSFAIDYTVIAPQTPTNGKFNVFWDSANLGPSQVAAIKSSHPNVKVGVSLGGAVIGVSRVQFQPSSVDSWVANAVSSLTEIIQRFNLDGINIDYMNFEKVDQNTFAECMGRLITILKKNGVIKFASIAPLPGSARYYYLELWNRYKDVIDHVNFQFYSYTPTTTVSQFLSYYDEAVAEYGEGNVLTSFSTESNGGGLRPDSGFFDAAKILKAQGKLHGIAVWTADTSASNSFRYDEEAQSMLVSR